MGEMLMDYGLFLAKVLTVVIAVAGAVVATVAALARRGHALDHLDIKHLNRKYEQMARLLQKEVLPKAAFKEAEKARKKKDKQERKKPSGEARKRVFVLNFHGDIRATAVASLREEITAVLSLARPDDEVLLRLENTGGLVHEHGLAASQLLRIKQRGVPLTVAVDKVAASGGYMMACVADRIIAAPFAIVGSVGVLAQIPNFHRLLNSHGIDFEQFKAGEYKRTVTLFGENTDQDRAKLQEELDDTHALFKGFVTEHRPDLNMERVGAGEHWYGARALELKLVDELLTSDAYLLDAAEGADLYEVTYATRKSFGERVASLVQHASEKLLESWWHWAALERLPK